MLIITFAVIVAFLFHACAFPCHCFSSSIHPAKRKAWTSAGKVEQKCPVCRSDPEILIPVEKIPSIPAFSKFSLDESGLVGSNSDLNTIVLSGERQRTLFISPGAVEIEDFLFKNGLFYILANRKGSEIIVLDREGVVISNFPVNPSPPTMTSIAVDSSGTIYHNNPSDPKGIITAYDVQGNIKKVFGQYLPERFLASMKLLNRTVMTVDDHDDLIVAFRFDPIVRKYDKNGELLFEKRISCKEIALREKEEKARFPERFTLTPENRVKITAFTYFTSIATDEMHNIYLKFGPDSHIFLLNESGDLEKKYLLTFADDPIEDFDFWESSIVVSEGSLYFPVPVQGSESFGYILRYEPKE